MKRRVDVFDYAGHILKALEPSGILLTTAAHGQVNTMAIGWGSIGIEWSRPIFTAYVRDSRYTRQLLAENGEFTVNIPLGPVDRSIIRVCGTKSGRDMDKISELGLHTVPSEVISVPGIRELPLTLECKVIYVEEQEPARQLEDIVRKYYPVDGHHAALYGQIVAAYIIED